MSYLNILLACLELCATNTKNFVAINLGRRGVYNWLWMVFPSAINWDLGWTLNHPEFHPLITNTQIGQSSYRIAGLLQIKEHETPCL